MTQRLPSMARLAGMIFVRRRSPGVRSSMGLIGGLNMFKELASAFAFEQKPARPPAPPTGMRAGSSTHTRRRRKGTCAHAQAVAHAAPHTHSRIIGELTAFSSNNEGFASIAAFSLKTGPNTVRFRALGVLLERF